MNWTKVAVVGIAWAGAVAIALVVHGSAADCVVAAVVVTLVTMFLR